MKLIKKKWFWVGIIFLLIFSIIFDLIILNAWAVYSISNGQWDNRLLLVAAGLLFSDGISTFLKSWKVKSQSLTRLIFFILIISAIIIHGFWNGLLFMSMILILSRLIKILLWIIKKGSDKFRRRGLLKEV